MKLPRWMRKPTAAEIIEANRIELEDAIAAEMMQLQSDIYATEKAIHAGQNNLRYYKQRLDFLRMSRAPTMSVSTGRDVASVKQRSLTSS